MNYAEWKKSVPLEIQEDALWNQKAYGLALFSSDLAWHDVTKLFRDGRTIKLAAQLFDAVGSVGANISEGYSRGFPKDRARFYEYALGSGRESRTWYFNARHVLGNPVTQHRVRLHTEIIRLLLTMLPPTRGYALHEGGIHDGAIVADDTAGQSDLSDGLTDLLEMVPLPEP